MLRYGHPGQLVYSVYPTRPGCPYLPVCRTSGLKSITENQKNRVSHVISAECCAKVQNMNIIICLQIRGILF